MTLNRTQWLVAFILAMVGAVASLRAQGGLNLVIIECETVGSVPYSGPLTFNYPVGGDAYGPANTALAGKIDGTWKCGVCDGDPADYSCDRVNLGTGAPQNYTVVSVVLTGGTWIVHAVYKGNVTVSCASC